MKLSKSYYYLDSIYKLLKNTDLNKILNNKNKIIHLRNGLKFKYLTWLDLLIIKETIIDDVYRLGKIEEAKIIVDISAGLGDFALFAAKKFPKATIYAFEPNPYLFSLLKENIRLNSLKNILLFQTAISSKKNLSLSIPKNYTQSSLNSKVISSEKISVKCQSLSDCIKGTIDFLKIDCEGGEKDIILENTEEFLVKTKNISLEYHCQFEPHMDKIIIKKLKDYGFGCINKPDFYDKKIGIVTASKC